MEDLGQRLDICEVLGTIKSHFTKLRSDSWVHEYVFKKAKNAFVEDRTVFKSKNLVESMDNAYEGFLMSLVKNTPLEEKAEGLENFILPDADEVDMKEWHGRDGYEQYSISTGDFSTIECSSSNSAASVSTEGVSIEEAIFEETVVEEAVVEGVPVEGVPIEEAPIEEAPIEEAPIKEAPIDETAVDETAVDEAIVKNLPSKNLPSSSLARAKPSTCSKRKDGRTASPVEPCSTKWPSDWLRLPGFRGSGRRMLQAISKGSASASWS
ncbi:hypothetical protein N0V95_003519 [Ascochyta clinopodiicola]|nr:hypothetical protein N0V95_003519 [Ascochyta clinopodiicola]